MRDVDWEREVASLGVSHRHVRLREYAIAVEKADLAFRQARRSTCLICEGWASDDTGYSLHDGRIDWAAFVPKLKSMGRAPVEAAVEAQRRHVQRIESLNYAQLVRPGAPSAGLGSRLALACASCRCLLRRGTGALASKLGARALRCARALRQRSACLLRQVRKLARWLSTEVVDAALLAGEAAAAAAAAAPAPAPLHADPLTLPIHMRERATRTTPPIMYSFS